MRHECDYLVLGSGVAGLSFALKAARHGSVYVLSKRAADDTASARAQGGIAAVLDPADSFEAHVQDTLRAGAGLCKREVVESVVREGPERIREMIDMGTRFSRREGQEHARGTEGLDLTREGGHSARRIVHAQDVTGRELQRALLEAVRHHRNIRLFEHHMAVDLLELSRLGLAGSRRVVGAYVLDEQRGEVDAFLARATILATGGSGKVYLYTSNPDVASGDGVAMAWRAGAEIANMEFFQFHPTCLYHPEAKSFLISEALRGEGGVLRLADGTPFMRRHHPDADLAPRDVVARAIDYEMKRTGAECVYLDMSARSADFLRRRFPTIHETCLRYGIDMTREPIPVVPAAHYQCGGVVVDMQGRTTLPGLWAIGEVSCTGLHGANRLASNSLLEGLVYGHRAGLALRDEPLPEKLPQVPEWNPGDAVDSEEAVVVTQNWDELRRFMWNYVGIVRTDRRLRRAARRIALLKDEIREYYWQHRVTRDMLELRNIADVAELIVACAIHRRESRGLHYTLDHPERDDADYGDDTVVQLGVPAHIRGH